MQLFLSWLHLVDYLLIIAQQSSKLPPSAGKLVGQINEL